MRYKVAEIGSWWNDKLKIMLIKCWIDDISQVWWNCKLITYQVNEIEINKISDWQNGYWTKW